MPERAKKTVGIAAGLVLLALAGRAAAQSNSDPGLGLGAHAAFSRAPDASTGFLLGGLQFRARLTGSIGVEALVSYRKDEFERAGEPVLRVTEIPVQASLLLFLFSSRPVQPYLLAGGGYTYVRTTGLGPNAAAGRGTENKFGLQAGAGVDVRVARRASVHADLRYVFLDVDALADLEKTLGAGLRADFWHATAGFNLYF